MHFDSDLHPVIGSEFGVFDPVRGHHFVPLPVENHAILGRPGTRHPIGRDSVRRVPRASGKVDNYRNSQLFGEQNGLATYLTILTRACLVGMQWIAVTTQGADAGTAVTQDFLKVSEGRSIF